VRRKDNELPENFGYLVAVPHRLVGRELPKQSHSAALVVLVPDGVVHHRQDQAADHDTHAVRGTQPSIRAVVRSPRELVPTVKKTGLFGGRRTKCDLTAVVELPVRLEPYLLLHNLEGDAENDERALSDGDVLDSLLNCKLTLSFAYELNPLFLLLRRM